MSRRLSRNIYFSTVRNLPLKWTSIKASLIVDVAGTLCRVVLDPPPLMMDWSGGRGVWTDPDAPRSVWPEDRFGRRWSPEGRERLRGGPYQRGVYEPSWTCRIVTPDETSWMYLLVEEGWTQEGKGTKQKRYRETV